MTTKNPVKKVIKSIGFTSEQREVIVELKQRKSGRLKTNHNRYECHCLDCDEERGYPMGHETDVIEWLAAHKGHNTRVSPTW